MKVVFCRVRWRWEKPIYEARFDTRQPHAFGSGSSPEEALGSLLMQNPRTVGLEFNLEAVEGPAKWTQPSHPDHQPDAEWEMETRLLGGGVQ